MKTIKKEKKIIKNLRQKDINKLNRKIKKNLESGNQKINLSKNK
jgi:hypothetical protein